MSVVPIEVQEFAQDPLEAARRELFRTGSSYAPVARDEIVGIDALLERVDEVVHWLRHVDEYRRHAARLEPGALLAGPPGTGKTLVSRYIAGTSDALFVDVREFPKSSDEKLSATDVAALFRLARETYVRTGRPVLLFCDEFDTIAPTRSGPPGVRIRPSELVMQLAAELDGINGKSAGVFFLACTNHPGAIDPALLRPGRLGIHFTFGPPDRAGREVLLQRYVGDLPIDESIDYAGLSQLFRPADPAAEVEEAVQQAWRRAARRAVASGSEARLESSDLATTLIERLIGHPPPSVEHLLSPKLQTAVHEIGHALVALATGLQVALVTVRPGRSGQGQMVLAPPESHARDVDAAKARIAVSFGGPVAERLAGTAPGIGNAQDTHMATSVALDLVANQMLGTRNRGFNPAALGGPAGREASQMVLSRIDADIDDVLDEAWAMAEQILQRGGRETVLELAQMLVDRETMLGAEFADEVAARQPWGSVSQ